MSCDVVFVFFYFLVALCFECELGKSVRKECCYVVRCPSLCNCCNSAGILSVRVVQQSYYVVCRGLIGWCGSRGNC